MGEMPSSETSVDFQRITQNYIPADRILHNHRCEKLRSYNKYSVLKAERQVWPDERVSATCPLGVNASKFETWFMVAQTHYRQAKYLSY
jgi:hypothetical protein